MSGAHLCEVNPLSFYGAGPSKLYEQYPGLIICFLEVFSCQQVLQVCIVHASLCVHQLADKQRGTSVHWLYSPVATPINYGLQVDVWKACTYL